MLLNTGHLAAGQDVGDTKTKKNRFDSIEATARSPRGKRVIIFARKAGKSYRLIDGEAKQIDYLPLFPVVFSENEESFAFAACRGKPRYRTRSLCTSCPLPKKSFCNDLVARGKKGVTARGELFEIEMKDKNAHVRCIPEPREWFVVHDGKELQMRQGTGISLTMSPDGKRLAYVVDNETNRDVIVLDGKSIDLGNTGEFRGIIGFSDNSRHFYMTVSLSDPVTHRDTFALSIDGKLRGRYHDIDFKSCGVRFLAMVEKADGQYLIWESGEIGPFKRVEWPTFFGPDCRGTAAVIQRGRKDTFWYNNKIMGDWVDEIGDFKTSRDGKRLAFIGQVLYPPEDHDNSCLKPVVVVDGVSGKVYDEIDFEYDFVFSPDGSRYAYIAKRTGKDEGKLDTFVVVDGKEYGPYPSISNTPCFSEDGSHVAFGVEEGNYRYSYLDFRKKYRDEDSWDEITTQLDDGTVVLKKDLRW